MTFRAVPSIRLALAFVAFALAPAPAQAGLVEATASFITLPAPGTQILGGTAPVTGGVEFTGNFGVAVWTLDLTATGVTLALDCSATNEGSLDCDYPDGLRLSLTGLHFSPPATLVGLTVLTNDPFNELVVSGTPLVTASSVIIDFQAFGSGSGEPLTTVFEAEFQVEPLAATPLPGALVLVAAGGLGAAALAIRRARD